MRLVLLALVACLPACSSWTRPNTTEAEFNADRYVCEQQASSTYPVNMQPSGSSYQTPAQTNCNSSGTQTRCTTTPGTYIAAPTSDTNSISRSFAERSCLQAKGYVRK